MHISEAEAFAAYFESWALQDFSAETNLVTAETLVIVGAHDRGISQEVAKATWITKLTRASLIVLPDSGHYPGNECPLILAAHVAAFLNPK